MDDREALNNLLVEILERLRKLEEAIYFDSIVPVEKIVEPEPVANAKAWCSIHSCPPHDCFYEHNPSAQR